MRARVDITLNGAEIVSQASKLFAAELKEKIEKGSFKEQLINSIARQMLHNITHEAQGYQFLKTQIKEQFGAYLKKYNDSVLRSARKDVAKQIYEELLRDKQEYLALTKKMIENDKDTA